MSKYKAGQVWSDLNYINVTLTIRAIFIDSVMQVVVNDGSSFERYRYFR